MDIVTVIGGEGKFEEDLASDSCLLSSDLLVLGSHLQSRLIANCNSPVAFVQS